MVDIVAPAAPGKRLPAAFPIERRERGSHAFSGRSTLARSIFGRPVHGPRQQRAATR
jgi:hypothetical protein